MQCRGAPQAPVVIGAGVPITKAGGAAMRCEEIMKTDVLCAYGNDTVESAAQTMRDANIGFLPVCAVSGEVLGTITDRDICIRVAAEDRIASECRVEEVMTHEVVACAPSDDIAEAERRMAQHHKSRILVVDQGSKLRGVISLSDLAQRDSLRRVAATLREVASREAHL